MAVHRVLTALSVLSLIACSAKAPPAGASSAPGDAQTDGSTSPQPPIHYNQTTVLTLSGELTEEKAYLTALEQCRKAGAFPVHALQPDEVEKIGREHLEAWIDPDKWTQHDERWSLDEPHPCQFALTHVDKTEFRDANGRSTTVDGVTHEVDIQELGKSPPVTALPSDDGEMTEADRQIGWSKLGITNFSGAQCAIWQDPMGSQLCVWTGGRQWGYSADGPSALKDGLSRNDSIVFWARPGRGPSWKLETKEFSVGEPLDSRAFVIPANAAHGS